MGTQQDEKQNLSKTDVLRRSQWHPNPERRWAPPGTHCHRNTMMKMKQARIRSDQSRPGLSTISSLIHVCQGEVNEKSATGGGNNDINNSAKSSTMAK